MQPTVSIIRPPETAAGEDTQPPHNHTPRFGFLPVVWIMRGLGKAKRLVARKPYYDYREYQAQRIAIERMRAEAYRLSYRI